MTLLPSPRPGWRLVHFRLLSYGQRATVYEIVDETRRWHAWVQDVGVLPSSFEDAEDAMRAAEQAAPWRVIGGNVLDDDGHLHLMAPIRDPRHNPRRGDVVQSRDTLGIHRFEVLGFDGAQVRYQDTGEPGEMVCSIEEWREHALFDTVLQRAESR